MADSSKKPFVAPFPIGGVSKRHGYAGQNPATTPSALNVFPTDWTTGRERGGTRPGLTNFGSSPSGAPYGWCPITFQTSGALKRGIAVVTASGTYTLTDFTAPYDAWTQSISAAPGSDFSTCHMFMQTLVQTSYGMQYPRILWMASGTSPWIDDGLLDAVITNYNTDAVPVPDPALPAPPEYCGIVSVHNARLVLAGAKNDPHVVYFSRMNSLVDWDYSAVDQQGAFTTASGKAGYIGEPVTALIPHTNDCLLIGGPDSLYVLRGNPRAGGHIHSLSTTTGPLMQSAWCKTDNDWTYMMTRAGLWRMPPGCGDSLQSVSREVLPIELLAINPGAGDRVCMGYDALFRGLLIFVDSTAYGKYGYFYDLQSGGFWPINYGSGTSWSGNAVHLIPSYPAAMTRDRSNLIQLMSDGTAKVFDRTDTAESFTSQVYLGPIAVGGSPYTDGVLTDIGAVLGEDSDPLSFAIYGGDSAQEAYNNPTQTFTGNAWSKQGLNHWQNPRVRATAAYIKAHASGTSRWQFEEIFGLNAPVSMRRVD